MTEPSFQQCARPGCGHARWHHLSGGPCRAGPDSYDCGCTGFAEPGEGEVTAHVLDEVLAIAAEETSLEKNLRHELKVLKQAVRGISLRGALCWCGVGLGNEAHGERCRAVRAAMGVREP